MKSEAILLRRRILSRLTLIALYLLLLAVPCAWADIYRYVDENGVVHFTNTPTSSRYALYLKDSVRDSGRRSDLVEIIRRYSSHFRLDEALVKAVIKVESDYNPRAVSRKGALGLMQLLPSTAKLLKVMDPMNPEENVRGGSRYLREMLDQFDGNLELALAAYNAGPNAVRRHGGIPPYEETRDYVTRVKKYMRFYRQGGTL